MVSIANALGASLDELACGSLVKSTHIYAGMIDSLVSDCTAEELKAISEVITAVKSALRSKG